MSKRRWIAVIAVMSAAIVGCQLITGLNGLAPGSDGAAPCVWGTSRFDDGCVFGP